MVLSSDGPLYPLIRGRWIRSSRPELRSGFGVGQGAGGGQHQEGLLGGGLEPFPQSAFGLACRLPSGQRLVEVFDLLGVDEGHRRMSGHQRPDLLRLGATEAGCAPAGRGPQRARRDRNQSRYLARAVFKASNAWRKVTPRGPCSAVWT